MRPVVAPDPVILPLLAITGLVLMVGTAVAAPAQPRPGTPAGPIIPAVPEIMQPLCGAPLTSDGEPWATRFPRQYREWEDSVHGRAYLSGNTDAPGCADCHGDPAGGATRTASFRLDIPARCAHCHADERRMSKYEIATDVYATYRADYHGWTIDYYRNQAPFAWRFEPVCSDCHRGHAIYSSDDPRSSIAPENLLATCQRCHPGAEQDFASITTGHFRIDRETSPLAYYIKAIYAVMIPLIIGLMGAYVGLDSASRLVRWCTRKVRS